MGDALRALEDEAHDAIEDAHQGDHDAAEAPHFEAIGDVDGVGKLRHHADLELRPLLAVVVIAVVAVWVPESVPSEGCHCDQGAQKHE